MTGKGTLPNSENLSTKDIHCGGCLSDDLFMHCRQCEIRDCTKDKNIEGCHLCDDFPCSFIENFSMSLGKRSFYGVCHTARKSAPKNGLKTRKNVTIALNAATGFSKGP